VLDRGIAAGSHGGEAEPARLRLPAEGDRLLSSMVDMVNEAPEVQDVFARLYLRELEPEAAVRQLVALGIPETGYAREYVQQIVTARDRAVSGGSPGGKAKRPRRISRLTRPMSAPTSTVATTRSTTTGSWIPWTRAGRRSTA
jgi:hypothetical protein